MRVSVDVTNFELLNHLNVKQKTKNKTMQTKNKNKRKHQNNKQENKRKQFK